MIALLARTSSTVVSNACCARTSTPSIASSLAPATTASAIAAVPPDREWNTTSRRGSVTTGRSGLVEEAGQVEGQVLAHVADMVDDDVAGLEVPFPVGTQEGVAVAAAHDRLQWQRGRLLEHDERRTRGRRTTDVVDVDEHVAVDV